MENKLVETAQWVIILTLCLVVYFQIKNVSLIENTNQTFNL